MPERLFTLYRFFANDDLLYIGATADLAMRLTQHSESKLWWKDITDIKLERFPSLAELEAAEVAAIKAEHPLHNVIHGYAPNPSALKPRGSKGDGTLFLRGDGKWIGRIELPMQGGKRKCKYVTSRDYETALAKFEALKDGQRDAR